MAPSRGQESNNIQLEICASSDLQLRRGRLHLAVHARRDEPPVRSIPDLHWGGERTAMAVNALTTHLCTRGDYARAERYGSIDDT